MKYNTLWCECDFKDESLLCRNFIYIHYIKVTRKLEKKFAQILEKSSQNSHPSPKCQNVYIKAQFVSAKHLQQTSFET
jgi:hypothetical protein